MICALLEDTVKRISTSVIHYRLYFLVPIQPMIDLHSKSFGVESFKSFNNNLGDMAEILIYILICTSKHFKQKLLCNTFY